MSVWCVCCVCNCVSGGLLFLPVVSGFVSVCVCVCMCVYVCLSVCLSVWLSVYLCVWCVCVCHVCVVICVVYVSLCVCVVSVCLCIRVCDICDFVCVASVYLCLCFCVCSTCLCICVCGICLCFYVCGICLYICVCDVLHVIDHWKCVCVCVHSRGACSRRQWAGHTSSAGWWRPWRRVLWADVCQATGHERSVLLHSTVEPPDRNGHPDEGCHPSFQTFSNTFLFTIISVLKFYIDIFCQSHKAQCAGYPLTVRCHTKEVTAITSIIFGVKKNWFKTK